MLQSQHVIREGYLLTKPPMKGGYKDRQTGWDHGYFILTSSELCYFKKKGDPKAQGSLKFSQSVVVDVQETELICSGLVHDCATVFKVCEIAENRITCIYINAPSVSVKQDWIDSIRNCIDQFQLLVVNDYDSPISNQHLNSSNVPIFFPDTPFPESLIQFESEGLGLVTEFMSSLQDWKQTLDSSLSESSKNSVDLVLVRYKDLSGQVIYEGTVLKGLPSGYGSVRIDGCSYSGEWEQGDIHGKGVFIHANGMTYDGEWLNNVFNGRGRLVLTADSVEYEGEWRNGSRHGSGTIKYLQLNGQENGMYTGSFEHGVQQGNGIQIWPSNSCQYNGEFQNNVGHGNGSLQTGHLTYVGTLDMGKLHGKGVMRWVDDGTNDYMVYVGQWEYDQIQGIGSLNYLSNCVSSNIFPGPFTYTGEFLNNQLHGHGELACRLDQHQFTFVGNWMNNCASGHGCINLDGNVYEGMWKEGVMHGSGVFTWNDGRIYMGHFENGTNHGHGTFSNANGDIFEGDFYKGVCKGHGQLQYTCGDQYVGDWDDNRMNGIGEYSFKNGDVYKGFFVSNIPGPFGRYYWSNGDVFSGHFDVIRGGYFIFGQILYSNGNVYVGEVNFRGVPHGIGIMYWLNGGRFEGEWNVGKRNGHGYMYTLNYDESQDVVIEGEFADDFMTECIDKREIANDERIESTALMHMVMPSCHESFSMVEQNYSMDEIEKQFYDSSHFKTRYRKLSGSNKDYEPDYSLRRDSLMKLPGFKHNTKLDMTIEPVPVKLVLNTMSLFDDHSSSDPEHFA